MLTGNFGNTQDFWNRDLEIDFQKRRTDEEAEINYKIKIKRQYKTFLHENILMKSSAIYIEY